MIVLVQDAARVSAIEAVERKETSHGRWCIVA